jgi:hypothetical protein
MTPFKTRTGLQIGRCWMPRRSPASFTRSEELVQRALLAQQPKPVPRRERIAGVLLAIFIGIAIAVLLVVYLSEGSSCPMPTCAP